MVLWGEKVFDMDLSFMLLISDVFEPGEEVFYD